jgi:hypothetical protein
MLFLETLIKKREFDNNGDKIIDLTVSTIKYSSEPDIKTAIIVSEDLAMRPDLIARIQYGDANKLDYILKYNGISNPFSLAPGQLLIIPEEDSMGKQFINPKVQSMGDSAGGNEIRNKIFDPNKLGKKDQKRLDHIMKKASQYNNGSKQNLSPNIAEPGSKEIKIKDGKIVFGEDVAGNAENCKEPFSRAKVKQKLLQKKIFNDGKL